MPRRAALAVAATLALAFFARTASAVPIPWVNCGAPGDILSISIFDASVWPPQGGTPAPLQATPTFDPATGHLVALRVHLVLGLDWVFEATGLDLPVVNGFVSLPASLPMTLVSPALPIPAGPVVLTETLTAPGPGLPITIASHATVAQAITSADVTLALTDNGTPGFTLADEIGAYQATIQFSETTGREVFCATFSLLNISFSSIPVSVPTLSSKTAALLAGLLAAAGVLALRR